MQSIIAKLRDLPLRAKGLIAIAAAAVLVPAGLNAWGPDRPTYTWDKPADHVTFNSITNNKVGWGDERNFVKVRNYTDNGAFTDNLNLEVGKEYEVQVYFHNNASETFNDAKHNYKGIARGAYARVQMPATVPSGEFARINGFVGAKNATPGEVWDEAYGKNTSAGAVNLRYVPNSAVIHSLGAVNGSQINLNSLVSDKAGQGALIGYDKLDGNLPGCNQFAGRITYRFKVDQPNFTIEKTVGFNPQKSADYVEKVTVNADSTVDFRIKYKNTGTEVQNNVIIKDVLPSGLTYVPGSTMIANSNTGNQWVDMTAGGQKTDAIVATNGANIGTHNPGGATYLKFKAKVDSSKLQCGANTFTNTAYAVTPNGTKEDTASVVVNKECEEKDIKVCDLKSKQIITIKESAFDKTKHSKNLKDCEEKPVEPKKTITVCKTDDKSIITINEDEFDESIHTKDLEKCKEQPVTPTPPTPVTPVTPQELPRTGLGEGVLSLVGVGSLGYALYAYIASRRIN